MLSTSASLGGLKRRPSEVEATLSAQLTVPERSRGHGNYDYDEWINNEAEKKIERAEILSHLTAAQTQYHFSDPAAASNGHYRS